MDGVVIIMLIVLFVMSMVLVIYCFVWIGSGAKDYWYLVVYL